MLVDFPLQNRYGLFYFFLILHFFFYIAVHTAGFLTAMHIRGYLAWSCSGVTTAAVEVNGIPKWTQFFVFTVFEGLHA